jgi:hypothetical protein
MTPDALLTELERICAIIDNPDSDNTAGRVDALQYETL